MPLLEVKHLHTFFKTKKGTVKAVNDVSYSLESKKTLGIVGESGSGKSVSAMSILQLLDANGYIESGEVLFEGKDLTKLSINFLGLSYVGLYAQLFPLTEKMGIDNQVLQKLIGNSGTNCGVFQFYSGKMINRTYDMAFSLENAHKDLSYVKELYENYQVPAFMLDGLLDMLRAGIRDGDGPRDYSASIDTMTR